MQPVQKFSLGRWSLAFSRHCHGLALALGLVSRHCAVLYLVVGSGTDRGRQKSTGTHTKTRQMPVELVTSPKQTARQCGPAQFEDQNVFEYRTPDLTQAAAASRLWICRVVLCCFCLCLFAKVFKSIKPSWEEVSCKWTS